MSEVKIIQADEMTAKPFMDRFLDGSCFADDAKELATAFASHRHQSTAELVEALERISVICGQGDVYERAQHADVAVLVATKALAKYRGDGEVG